MRKKYLLSTFIALSIFVVIILLGCNDMNNVITPTMLESTSKTQSTEIVKSTSTRVTPTTTPAPSSDKSNWFSNTIEPGEYIFIGGVDEEYQNVYYLMSDNDHSQQHLAISDDWATVHPVGSHGSVLLFEINIDESLMYDSAPFAKTYYASLSEPQKVVELPEDYWYRGISPNDEYLLISNRRNDFPYGIGVVDVSTLEITKLVNVENSDTWLSHFLGTPNFSPDGKWIMFYNFPLQKENRQSGLYLLPASCINNPRACQEQVLGPFWHDNMWAIDEEYSSVWSPDSNEIVMAGKFESNESMGMLIFNIETQEFTEIDLGVSFAPAHFHWSEDGNYISFISWGGSNQKNDIYTYDLITGELVSFTIDDVFELVFVRWFTIQ